MTNIENNEYYKIINQAHPHIGYKIKLLWGTFKMPDYFNSLFMDTRDGKRKGFSKDVASSLYKLSSLHEEEFPGLYETLRPWEDVHKRK